MFWRGSICCRSNVMTSVIHCKSLIQSLLFAVSCFNDANPFSASWYEGLFLESIKSCHSLSVLWIWGRNLSHLLSVIAREMKLMLYWDTKISLYLLQVASCSSFSSQFYIKFMHVCILNSGDKYVTFGLSFLEYCEGYLFNDAICFLSASNLDGAR